MSNNQILLKSKNIKVYYPSINTFTNLEGLEKNITCNILDLTYKSGCGSVWLEHCVRDAGVGGSNTLTPTIFFVL